MRCARWFECDHSHGTAGVIYDLQWRSDHGRAGQRQKIEIGQAGQSKLAVAVHDEVIAKRWIKESGLSSVCADGLDANPKNVPLLGKGKRHFPPAGTGFRVKWMRDRASTLGCGRSCECAEMFTGRSGVGPPGIPSISPAVLLDGGDQGRELWSNFEILLMP